MKIAFIGTQCNGKTTLIKEFLQTWPMYKRPEKTYRDIIAEKKIKLNQKGDEKSQRVILDALIDETQAACASEEENILKENFSKHKRFQKCDSSDPFDIFRSAAIIINAI